MATDPVPASGAEVILDSRQQYQVIDGFGGCFNELGWEALESLPAERREAALRELFSPEGANFNLGRAPIGANDFSLGWYSLDETAGDYEMKDFSIARTREALVPFIKAAMRYQPKLGIWATPWCPPSWMTTNGRYRQGCMRGDSRTLDAYALYLAKFVQAWRAEGIPLYAIHPQNEMALNTNLYPQCVWDSDTLNRFLRDHLLPRLRRDGVDIEVWLGTVVNERLSEYVDPVLGDPATAPGITGVGYQYGGQKALAETHRRYPDKKLSQTETECYGGGNEWGQALLTFGHLVEDLQNHAGSYFFWNMVLDESGLSRWNWRQNSLLTVDRRSESVIYNPEFYAMKLFSSVVVPGSRRIGVTGQGALPMVAFETPDEGKVLLVANPNAQAARLQVREGTHWVDLELPAQSMNSVCFR